MSTGNTSSPAVGAEQLLTADEVAGLLKVPKRWVYEAARRGDLPSAKMGKYLRFRQRDVAAFVARRFTEFC